MRREERAVTEREALKTIINQCKVIRIAVMDKDGLYIVPLNFGWHDDGENLIFYFHSAKEGRKVAAFQQNEQVAFEMDCAHELVVGKTACQYGYRYQSIVGVGHLALVEDEKEKVAALNYLMQHQCGQIFAFSSAMLTSVNVYRLIAEEISGKSCS